MIVAPYEEREGWSINIMQINRVLYFEEHLTDAQLDAKYGSLPPFPSHLSITSLFPQKPPRTQAPPIDILRLLFRIMVHL